MIKFLSSLSNFFVGVLCLLTCLRNCLAAGADDDLLAAASSRRDLQAEVFPFGYVEPAWYDAIKEGFTGVNLKRCVKRNPNGPKDIPVTGQPCAKTPKTCFFGDKSCGIGTESYPEAKCFCDGKDGSQTWTCEEEFCPGCPPDGQGFEFFNDALCPAVSPGSTSICTPEQDGISCNYGREDCCGRCNASLSWTCDANEGRWFGFNTDACFLGPEGCCPSFEASSTALCFQPGAQCTYQGVPSTIPGGICTGDVTCTCGFPGALTYACETTSVSCVSADPPSFP